MLEGQHVYVGRRIVVEPVLVGFVIIFKGKFGCKDKIAVLQGFQGILQTEPAQFPVDPLKCCLQFRDRKMCVIRHQVLHPVPMRDLDIEQRRTFHLLPQAFGDINPTDRAAFIFNPNPSARIELVKPHHQVVFKLLDGGLGQFSDTAERRTLVPGEPFEVEHLLTLRLQGMQNMRFARARSASYNDKTERQTFKIIQCVTSK